MKRVRFLQTARNLYEAPDGDIEIDDDARLSEAHEAGGAWLAAWVWVNHEEVTD